MLTMMPVKNVQKKKMIAFGWYGGKYSHLNWLLPLLPKSVHYCEPFAGSAAVLINREPRLWRPIMILMEKSRIFVSSGIIQMKF